ncbi:MAG: hypothetical protein ACK587_15780 [Cyanobacteriota bacterium]
MSVHIDAVSTIVEASAPATGAADHDAGASVGGATEVRLEDLRPLVRALVAEEIERWLRSRGLMP